MRILSVLICTCLAALLVNNANAQSRVDRNVVFGMHSGLALLMDIHYPDSPNGKGVVFIMGNGWHQELSYDAKPLREAAMFPEFGAPALVDAGYTVFAISHRAAPRFHYPAAVEDVRRAMRFIRRNSEQYRVDPDRLGAAGMSSGAYLAHMLGTLDEDSAIDGRRLHNESSRAQAVVALAGPGDLLSFAGSPEGARHVVASFLGAVYWQKMRPDSAEGKLYREASPVGHVTVDDAPVLLVHGTKDNVVPYGQSEAMYRALQEAGVESRLITIPDAGHDLGLFQEAPPINVSQEMIDWFDRHLKSGG
ncbi:prolyl oligopeptidase family serine peptidase [Microbulbifer agarilyticus]|uniref:prolyl oligopeptidase family serine peptidase n=1 Tax=Microbulbifer agarilyticus TaxID=260552 RepID=UPI001CD5F805|nr:prolyl oligopeptidase family serine peptidase [Microbulbifer agarilyticus]MCA0901110.1 prolyl oligopeptidase family serine peptidase [Microbulbifer agarilyticus]